MKSTADYITLLRAYMAQNATKYSIKRMGIFGSVDLVRLRERMDSLLKSRIEKEGIYV